MGNESRKRVYSQIQSDYTTVHSNRYHKGLKVTYTAVVDSKQKKLCFTNILSAGTSDVVNNNPDSAETESSKSVLKDNECAIREDDSGT